MSLSAILLGAAPKRLLLGAAAAMVAAAPFCTVTEKDVLRFHQAHDPVNFYEARAGALYAVDPETAEHARTPICAYSANGGPASEKAATDHVYSGYVNIAGDYLPVEPVLALMFPSGGHARSALDYPTALRVLDTAARPGPDADCEAAIAEAIHLRGEVVCVVESVVTSRGRRVGVSFKAASHFIPAEGAAWSAGPACPLAAPTDLFWAIKRPFIDGREAPVATAEAPAGGEAA